LGLRACSYRLDTEIKEYGYTVFLDLNGFKLRKAEYIRENNHYLFPQTNSDEILLVSNIDFSKIRSISIIRVIRVLFLGSKKDVSWQ
jgi:hypothetical protein